jgi:hypothetical protein
VSRPRLLSDTSHFLWRTIAVVEDGRVAIPTEEGSGSRARRARHHRGVVPLLVFVVLVGACLPIGIAEDWREAFIKIYNRTLTSISYEGGWVPICSMGVQSGLPPWPSPITSPPPGSPSITFDLDVPADYKGVISVIVSEKGVEVIHGEVNERDLPECAGRPPP